MSQLAVNEIFFSIQGESSHAGRPCIFVRLQGCPLRCKYCDTEYAFYEGQKKSFEAVLEALQEYPCKLVELTGGEPLAQPAAYDFLTTLADQGFEVLLETSGAFPLEPIDKRVKVIMDIKCPSSGESTRNLLENIPHLKKGIDEVKFVVENSEDLDFARRVSVDYRLFDQCTVLVSPSFGKLSYLELANWVLESALPFRMQIQMHKHIWDPQKRGV